MKNKNKAAQHGTGTETAQNETVTNVTPSVETTNETVVDKTNDETVVNETDAVVTEMTEQKESESVYSIDVPKGAAGIWRISISGGRQFDRYEIKFSGSKSWGVRGEMSLPVNDSIPNPAYLYLPSSVKQIAIERIGGTEDSMEIFDESGKSLGFPSKNAKSGERSVLQLDDPPANSVLKLAFKNAEKVVILIDGVPGLLCPSPEIARDL